MENKYGLIVFSGVGVRTLMSVYSLRTMAHCFSIRPELSCAFVILLKAGVTNYGLC